jgi:putative transcription factor
MDQDWKPIVLNAGGKKKTTPRDPLLGGVVVKKESSNKQKSPDNLSKIAKTETAEPIQRVGVELSKKIQQARVSKGLTQEQLANKINEQKSVINSYESGKAIPDNRILIKLEKILGPLR